MTDPAVLALAQTLTAGERVWAQVVIRVAGPGFSLRHISDSTRADPELTVVRLQDLRSIAQLTASGAFRPLKSAPNLKPGWLCTVTSSAELGQALRILYPGSVADWHAFRSGAAQPTSYRDYVGRQSGMYRVTQKLTDTQAAQVVRACCAPAFCLKQRLWTVQGISADIAADKSPLACLEPCALLLELARKAVRLDQETAEAVRLSPTEIDVIVEALRAAAAPRPAVREADFSAPLNPRVAALVCERLRAHASGPDVADEVTRRTR